MEERREFLPTARQPGSSQIARKPLEPRTTSIDDSSLEAGDMLHTAGAASRINQAKVALIFYPFALATIVACLISIIWLFLHGPALVPGQDTRRTAFVISIGSRLAGLFIGIAIVRSAWAAFLPLVLQGDSVSSASLIGVCRNFLSLGQLNSYLSLPTSFRYHVILGAFVMLAMAAASTSVRYDSLGLNGHSLAAVPDWASRCNLSRIQSAGYFCVGAENPNNTRVTWSYADDIYTGGQNTVHRYGQPGDPKLGANVTIATIPPGWTLSDDNNNNLPWMAIWVSCRPLPISASFSGSYYTSTSEIYVNDTLLDSLDIANMPEWGSYIHIYQQFNESGPLSSLSPWIAVFLARDMDDGTSNLQGVAGDSVTYLGDQYLDLRGYGPYVQGVLGAAAYCDFSGSTGGDWLDVLWPPLNHTKNVVIGTVIDDRPTLGTVVLNYGPSWQYNPVSENFLPGGSVSYIANITDANGVSFPDFFASYIRNQWALTAYAITPGSGVLNSLPFTGPGPNKLYISLTIISVLPSSALVIGLLVTVRAWFCTYRQRRWVNRIEFESWWLAKALRPDIGPPGYTEATEKVWTRTLELGTVAYRNMRSDRMWGIGFCVRCSRTKRRLEHRSPPGQGERKFSCAALASRIWMDLSRILENEMKATPLLSCVKSFTSSW